MPMSYPSVHKSNSSSKGLEKIGFSKSQEFMFFTFFMLTLKTFSTAVSPNASYGKITFTNGSKEMVRVHLRPSLIWNYFESRTNQTLRRGPDRRLGSNRVP